MKIHLLWDFLTGSILQLRITPGGASDATNPIAQEVAPAGSLSLFDLGYFCLDRFQNLTRAGAFWISRLQHGTSVFDAQGQPLALLQYLRQQTGSGPIDVSVLLGVSHRLPCRLIALRVPQEVADRRRQKAYVKAQKHGRVPSREYLEWQDWTIFVTNCEPELLTWEAVVVLYRARWQIELMFKLWKSHNRLFAIPEPGSGWTARKVFSRRSIAAKDPTRPASGKIRPARPGRRSGGAGQTSSGNGSSHKTDESRQRCRVSQARTLRVLSQGAG